MGTHSNCISGRREGYEIKKENGKTRWKVEETLSLASGSNRQKEVEGKRKVLDSQRRQVLKKKENDVLQVSSLSSEKECPVNDLVNMV